MIKLLQILYNAEKDGYLTYDKNNEKIPIQVSASFNFTNRKISPCIYNLHDKIIVNGNRILECDKIKLNYQLSEHVKEFFNCEIFKPIHKNQELILNAIKDKNCFFEDKYLISAINKLGGWFNSDFENNLKPLYISLKIAKNLIKKSDLNEYEDLFIKCFNDFYHYAEMKHIEKLPF